MKIVSCIFFVILFFQLALNYFVAKAFENIAYAKGNVGKIYFWWCFWLGIVGWLMVIALPDRSSLSNIETCELPEL